MLIKKILIFFIAWTILFSTSSGVAFADLDKKNITIILKQGSFMHEGTVSELIKVIEDDASVNVTFDYVYKSDAVKINELKNKNIDLAISIGAESANAILASNPKYPVLYTLIPKQTLDALYKRYNQNKKNMRAIYLTQPISRKLRLSKIILNKTSRVGVTLGTRKSYVEEELLRDAKKENLTLHIKYADDYSKSVDAMSDALSDSDIYLALYDSTVLNRHTAKWLLYMAYKKGKPVIGFSSGYTKAGAIASVYSTPKQIGTQTADWVINSLTNKNIQMVQSPKYFTVSVNKRIQRILRLKNISSKYIESKLHEMEDGAQYE